MNIISFLAIVILMATTVTPYVMTGNYLSNDGHVYNALQNGDNQFVVATSSIGKVQFCFTTIAKDPSSNPPAPGFRKFVPMFNTSSPLLEQVHEASL